LATSSDAPPSGTPAGGSAGLRGKIGGALGGAGKGSSDHLTILSGTAQNLVGLAIFALAGVGIKIMIPHAFGHAGSAVLGVVGAATQFAFIVAAATRFGMDMAATRRVAIELGKGEVGRSRAIVRRAVAIAFGVSLVLAAIVFLSASWLAREFRATTPVFQAAALAIPFVALCQTWVAASRGLKIMTHTLYAYWVGQSVSWIVFSLLFWQVSKTPAATVYAYAASWIFGTLIAAFLWWRSTSKYEQMRAEPHEVNALVRYGAPRAPAALLSQALFWTDYFVLSIYIAPGIRGQTERGAYYAAVTVTQLLVLFLTAASYMFSPFVADLHERGEREKLDGLFKSITRWTLAATLPILCLLLVLPGPVLHLFKAPPGYGTMQLRILLIGQIVNVSVGAAGFILIMTRRTGWDLIVYSSSFLLDLVVSFALIGGSHMGSTGAAVAQTVTIAFSNAFRMYLVWKFVGIHPYNRYYFKLLIPFAACLATMFVLAPLLGSAKAIVQIVLVGAIGTALYLAVFATTCLTPTEREGAKRLLGRGGARSDAAV
jgi:O-antigen/teichoic acid export membrane protein